MFFSLMKSRIFDFISGDIFLNKPKGEMYLPPYDLEVSFIF